MQKTINLDFPINSTSLGQVSYNFYKALSKRNNVHLFPYANNVELSCFELTEQEKINIKKSCASSETEFSRNDFSLKCWHIQGSERALGRSNSLFTFHETDRLTKYEINKLEQFENVFVSSKYTKEVFDSHSLSCKVIHCPLGFDSDSFFKIPKDQNEPIISFGLRGKLEFRKNTLKILSAWAKTFGGDPRYRLDCSVANQFYDTNEQMQMIMEAMPDRTLPWNINLLPFLPGNASYNHALNQADIDLTGMSGCEGFNLPLFQSLCLGKQVIVLNAHVHKDFCNAENSILVEPSGMREAVDNKFFFKGHIVNQGQWFDFKESDLIDAMVFAAEKGRVNNTEGEKLKSWTYEASSAIIQNEIEKY